MFPRPRLTLALTLSLLFLGCAATGDPVPRRTDSGVPDSGVLSRESCGDGLDTDRDGLVDEGCACEPGTEQLCFRGDPDLAGIGACIFGTQRCTSDFELDTHWEPCEGDGFPGTDLCNGIDDDCDFEIDEGCSCLDGDERSCYDGPAGTEGVGLCHGGSQRCFGAGEGSAWDGCGGAVVPREERCGTGEDEDCDGLIDEGCTCDLGTSISCFGGPPESRGVGDCRVGEQTCVTGSGGASEWTSCIGESRPGTESCSGGRDEDCDGLTDCADPDCAAFCCEGFSESLPVIPAEGEILFIIDRSGSMQWPAVGTTRSRWDELIDGMDSVLPLLTPIPMGMLTFPEQDGSDERGNCSVAPSPDVNMSMGTGSSISSRLRAVDPRAGDTPTPTAFNVAQSYLSGVSTSRERFIILATDGLPEPACGATVPATVSSISSIRSRLGVDTFVIGIVGPDRSGDTSGIPALRAGLNEMADAGGRPRSGANRYYEAVDGSSLSSALRAVIAAATDCAFTLSSTPPRPSSVEVRQGSTLVPRSSWTLSGRSLSISGVYCDRIRAGLVTSITVSDPC